MKFLSLYGGYIVLLVLVIAAVVAAILAFRVWRSNQERSMRASNATIRHASAQQNIIDLDETADILGRFVDAAEDDPVIAISMGSLVDESKIMLHRLGRRGVEPKRPQSYQPQRRTS